MLDVLYALEKEMPQMIRNERLWRSVSILFKPSFKIDRFVADWKHEGKEYRIRLHQFHPYDRREDAVIHHHEWPMASRICRGKYELQLGYSSSNDQPRAQTTVHVQTGDVYEMVDVDMWHSVRPLEPTWTLMVFGEGPSGSHWPIKREKPPCSGFEQYRMDTMTTVQMFNRFKHYYPLPRVEEEPAPVA